MNSEKFRLQMQQEIEAVGVEEMRKWAPGKLIDWITDKVTDLLASVDMDEASLEEVLENAKAIYDEFVAPIDLPYIPNLVVEPYVDDRIWDVIEFLLKHYLT